MISGAAKADITPKGNVWMDGMIRTHRSVGVHDPLFARVMYLSSGDARCAIVSLDVCTIGEDDSKAIRQSAQSRTGIPAENIIIAASHTHSGPATIGFFSDSEPVYVSELVEKTVGAIAAAVESAKPAAVGSASGVENTISHYRRFRSDDGRIVMIWEENPADGHLKVLGESDPDLVVLKVVDAADPANAVGILFNHAGHPNVMSGENYLISSDYPGAAERMVEETFGCPALFTNGAQGTVDIDNWTYRDWDGVEIIGGALAKAVTETARAIDVSGSPELRVGRMQYALPRRRISPELLRWADEIIRQSGGKVEAKPDGVGDDYKALLYKRIHERRNEDIEVEQVCIAVGDAAIISFPGELFTEIGRTIKNSSPFAHTCIADLSNGYVGYIPTREAIGQGGYEVDTRHVDENAADTITQNSLALLRRVREAY